MEGSPFFEGKNQCESYSKMPIYISEGQQERDEDHGCGRGGSWHVLLQYGCDTTVALFCTVSHTIVLVCIKNVWMMVGVKDKYLFRDCAEDQFFGWCACGLNQLENTF